MNRQVIPAGLDFLYNVCRRTYPDQPNPLQVTALVKYWLGGPDPLDYISLYFNPGEPSQNIPAHWHYISFGLSDLHGDGRVHEVGDSPGLSGFGFELTLRIQCDNPEQSSSPPTWPAMLMQSLAKYVFQTGSSFFSGDHISWHCALDNGDSRIQHMLLTEDVQLGSHTAPFGHVKFLQIVGLTSDELLAAQKWNGSGLLNIMKRNPLCGGPWLLTNTKRTSSLFELEPNSAQEVERGIEVDGSDLSGVSATFTWKVIDEESSGEIKEFKSMSEAFQSQLNKTDGNVLDTKLDSLKEKLSDVYPNFSQYRDPSAKDKYDFENPSSLGDDEEKTSPPLKVLPSLHLTINSEAASLLPLALRGRLKHGRHFTFKSSNGSALTFLTSAVEGGFVTEQSPFAVCGPWLQVLLADHVLHEISEDLAPLVENSAIRFPVAFSWPKYRLKIYVTNDL